MTTLSPMVTNKSINKSAYNNPTLQHQSTRTPINALNQTLNRAKSANNVTNPSTPKTAIQQTRHKKRLRQNPEWFTQPTHSNPRAHHSATHVSSQSSESYPTTKVINRIPSTQQSKHSKPKPVNVQSPKQPTSYHARCITQISNSHLHAHAIHPNIRNPSRPVRHSLPVCKHRADNDRRSINPATHNNAKTYIYQVFCMTPNQRQRPNPHAIYNIKQCNNIMPTTYAGNPILTRKEQSQNQQNTATYYESKYKSVSLNLSHILKKTWNFIKNASNQAYAICNTKPLSNPASTTLTYKSTQPQEDYNQEVQQITQPQICVTCALLPINPTLSPALDNHKHLPTKAQNSKHYKHTTLKSANPSKSNSRYIISNLQQINIPRQFSNPPLNHSEQHDQRLTEIPHIHHYSPPSNVCLHSPYNPRNYTPIKCRNREHHNPIPKSATYSKLNSSLYYINPPTNQPTKATTKSPGNEAPTHPTPSENPTTHHLAPTNICLHSPTAHVAVHYPTNRRNRNYHKHLHTPTSLQTARKLRHPEQHAQHPRNPTRSPPRTYKLCLHSPVTHVTVHYPQITGTGITHNYQKPTLCHMQTPQTVNTPNTSNLKLRHLSVNKAKYSSIPVSTSTTVASKFPKIQPHMTQHPKAHVTPITGTYVTVQNPYKTQPQQVCASPNLRYHKPNSRHSPISTKLHTHSASSRRLPTKHSALSLYTRHKPPKHSNSILVKYTRNSHHTNMPFVHITPRKPKYRIHGRPHQVTSSTRTQIPQATNRNTVTHIKKHPKSKGQTASHANP
eukprot:gene3023-2005_t